MTTKIKQYDLESKAYTTTGTASAYELTIPKLEALYDEMIFVVEFHLDCLASPTLEINGLGVIPLLTSEGNALAADDLKTTGRYTLVYDATIMGFVSGGTIKSEVVDWVGGGVGVMPGFNEPYTDNTFTAGENITIGQHCALTTYGPYLRLENDTIYTISGATFDYGQCFDWQVTTTLDTLEWRISATTTNSNALSVTAKIYAITGTYGVDAVKTGAALYTSDTLSQPSPFRGGTCTMTFTFGDIIPAGQYIVMFEGSHQTSHSQQYELKGKLSPAPYLGNTADGVISTADQNLAIRMKTLEGVVMISDASYYDISSWCGVATETVLGGDSILLQTKGEITQLGALDNRFLRYLSDTPGELSMTPGANVCIIGQGSGINKVWMGRDNYDTKVINRNDIHFTNTGGVAGGSFNITYTGTNTGGTVTILTSLDKITRQKISSGGYMNGNGGDNSPAGQGIIPAGVYFQVAYSPAGPGSGIATYIDHGAYFRPIK